jgi:hypothetical protein
MRAAAAGTEATRHASAPALSSLVHVQDVREHVGFAVYHLSVRYRGRRQHQQVYLLSGPSSRLPGQVGASTPAVTRYYDRTHRATPNRDLDPRAAIPSRGERPVSMYARVSDMVRVFSRASLA